MLKYILRVILFSLIALNSYAVPVITSVDTTQLAQGVITIRGSGFGNGPKVEIYDDFEHSGALTSGSIDISKSLIRGKWTSKSNNPTYDNFSLSGHHSFEGWDHKVRKTAQLSHKFTTPIQSLYVSYWVAIPPHYHFPGNDSAYNGFSGDSSWKMTWFIDLDHSGKSSDVCIPTHVGRGGTKIAGNDANLDWGLPNFKTWWSWGKWIRITGWIMAPPGDPTATGRLRFSTWSEEFGHYVYDNVQKVYDTDGPATKEYKYVNIPGWIRSSSSNNIRPLYDDIYIASGSNAYARVELTDKKDYKSSTKFVIQDIVNWSNNTITFRTIASNIKDVNSSSIHVFVNDGSSTTNGMQLKGVSKPTPSPTPIPPPISIPLPKTTPTPPICNCPCVCQ
jgi:hypothetical protein